MTFSEKICETAREGMVLLRNNDSTLPFTKDDRISVFGRMQKEFLKSGMGSGGSVHAIYSTNLIDELSALEKKGLLHINRKPTEIYLDWIKGHPYDTGGGQWAGEPWSQKEMVLTLEQAKEAAAVSDKAVYVIGRNAGEDKDLQKTEGSWYLSPEERESLKNICAAFSKVTVIFNTCSIMDTSFIDDKDFGGNITAVLYAWMGGMESGRSTAQILCGIDSPSGKLTDTIARSIEDYPSTKNFGNEDQNFYEEDIYVGYRYFNTFAKDRILFPFGFGLSYSTFSVKARGVKKDGLDLTVEAEVTNTGKAAGKEVVQLYIEPPAGLLGRPAVELCAFAKTRKLEPGQSETLTLKCSLGDFAAYDETGLTGFTSAFVLEKGTYRIMCGTDSLSLSPVEFDSSNEIILEETVCVEQCSQAAAPVKKFQRIRNSNGKPVMEDVPLSTINMEERIQKNLPKPFARKEGTIHFDDVKKNHDLLEAFIAQLDVHQLGTIVRGEGMMSAKVTMGITAAYGGVSESLHAMGIPVAGCADGPSGIRVDTGREASLMPIGTQIACTWNEDLSRELFEFEGEELIKYEIDSLLGPGINIHRSPLNGRNFEYFSEDPYITGCMARSQIRGLKNGGSSGTIKHYAGNNQEKCRNVCDSVVSERALREIYLKAFKMTVKDGCLVSLMSSYNPVNGHWAASNYDLINTILRREWNYQGVVMTDWWAKMNDCVNGGEASIKNTAFMVRAGNDIYMIVDNDCADTNGYGDNIEDFVKQGKLTVAELQVCAKHILDFILQAPVSKRPLRKLKELRSFRTEVAKPEDVKESGCRIMNERDNFIPDDTTWLYADHQGIYNISGTYSKDSDDLSQSVTNILIDGQVAASLDCRSTQGKDTTVNASQVELFPGVYKVSLAHTKPGISVKNISFNSQVITPVSLGVVK